MFEFDGDYFNATAIMAVEQVEKTLTIYLYGETQIEYEYDDFKEAENHKQQFVTAWSKAIA